MPVYLCSQIIALSFPCSKSHFQGFYAVDTPGQALPGHDIKLYFGNIKPTSVLGRIVNLQLPKDTSCLSGRELFI